MSPALPQSCPSRDGELHSSRQPVAVRSRRLVCGAAASKVQVNYLPIRGRAEPIRLVLAAVGEDWEENDIGSFDEHAEGMANIKWTSALKQDADMFPFCQAPSLTVDGKTYPQSNAIVRHLGRKHGLYGQSEPDALWVDAIMDGVDDLRRPWGMLLYVDLMKEGGLDKYWENRGNPASMTNFTGGGHFGYLSRVYKRTRGSAGFCVGDSLSIADIELFDIVDGHLPLFPEKLPAQYPELAEHHALISKQEGIQQYLASPRRFPWTLGNTLLKNDKLQSEQIPKMREAVEQFLAMKAQS